MYWVLFLLLTVLLAVFAVIIFAHKQILSDMLGMCVAMAIGMTTGLASGTLFGLIASNSFFEATIISMFIGAFIGVLFGFPFSIVAIIDGFISGLMGGMMGVMLAVMVPPENSLPLIQIMFLLLFGTLFILYIALQSELKKTDQKWFVLKPVWYFLFICISFVCIHFLDTPSTSPNEQQQMDHHHVYTKQLTT